MIYNGVHYDALTVTARPNAASWDDDMAEFNPRSKRGKLILEAARQLVRLNNKAFAAADRGKQAAAQMASAAVKASSPAGAAMGVDAKDAVTSAGGSRAEAAELHLGRLRCSDCGAELAGKALALAHAEETGHQRFEQCSE